MSTSDPFQAAATLKTRSGEVRYYRLEAAAAHGDIATLPYSIRVLLESALRACDGFVVTEDHVKTIAAWEPRGQRDEIPFLPGRVVLQDFTGVPAVVDLAAMRDAVARLGGDPTKINPQVPCDLVIDHSVQVDYFGDAEAYGKNLAVEFERNHERYEFLRWGQKALSNFRVVPPGTGIIHQVNLEYLATTVLTKTVDGVTTAYPDSLVGTDSHTTMINGLGVLGWGVGGIEAEAVMLGQPIYMLLPDVVGVELSGSLGEGATATDLVLTITELLRKHGVVNKFVEFCGPGLNQLSLSDRAVIANMAPEYGATCGFFPVDEETIRFLRLTAREPEVVELAEKYYKAQGLFRSAQSPTPRFTSLLQVDLGSIGPSLAGPKRPQDRVTLSALGQGFRAALVAPVEQRGFALTAETLSASGSATSKGEAFTMRHGSVAIAAITSCTNTSSPSVMIAAGLVAKKAVERGLRVPPYVKTSLAPGSRVVTAYLEKLGLDQALDSLGFQTVGYGCTTCIGNSGPLTEPVVEAIRQGDLVAASVLSGNRNFEGRVNPHVKANYLASPPLVVAFALAGRVDLDLSSEPVGTDTNGKPVYLRELWPTQAEIQAAIESAVDDDLFRSKYADVFAGTPEWQAIPAANSQRYAWNEASTYIQNPPFFATMQREPATVQPITGARVLVMVGDSVTTDHISPAGNISKKSPAADYLRSLGVVDNDFNSYGARRGNDRIMTRGTFANIRLRNLLVPGSEGGVSVHLPSGEQGSIYDVSMRYQAESTALLVLAGKEYGTGSSRDWAAKGTALLGVRAVIAESYERIHRSNLVGMGILPLQYKAGDSAKSLGLSGRETFAIIFPAELKPGQDITVTVRDDSGTERSIVVQSRIDTPVEVSYYRHGGILQTVIRQLL